MRESTRREYDKSRKIADHPFRSACYAPFTSLYFWPTGDVTPCCQTLRNGFTLGNVATDDLEAIWNGRENRRLRDSLARYDFPVECDFCRWQIEGGDPQGAFATVFDEFIPRSRDSRKPVAMEFSMSNACNFECIMCDGFNSSRIRRRREKLPPLEKPYGDRFMSDLEKYLPGLRWAHFFGGEPFLSPENYRVWQNLGRGGDSGRTRVRITTNGSIFNGKVEAALEAMAADIVISLDAVSPEVLGQVRLHSRHARLMENIRRFKSYTDRKGTSLSFAYCLMVQTWFEFPDLLLFAENLRSRVFVNTVTEPAVCSVYALPAEELAEVVGRLERMGNQMHLSAILGINREVWTQTLRDLKAHADTGLREERDGKR